VWDTQTSGKEFQYHSARDRPVTLAVEDDQTAGPDCASAETLAAMIDNSWSEAERREKEPGVVAHLVECPRCLHAFAAAVISRRIVPDPGGTE
jgi:hypothetical protein